MSHKIMALAAIGLAFTGVSLPDQAQARERVRSSSVEGSSGRGYQRQRQATRTDGTTQVKRGTQTNSGRGVETVRNGSCADSTCTGDTTHTTNGGTSFGRNGSATANSDGTGTFEGTRTGPAGGGGSVNGTVSHTPPQ